ncbi:amidase [Hansschlegelia zhihuaiae]|uniref:amidase n=1 Tax=Hansschlegelia zhihuaiae TaxID=405005 RepID=UPI001FE01EFC|nr:amidase [Hansschlegelia zhihuaiae]
MNDILEIDDTVGAFVAHGREGRAPTTAEGPLAGLSFALKDLFDVKGVPTAAGNPDWLRTHPVPASTAPVARRLLDAGARLAGKTLTDEIAWSLTGENFHYGTPANAAAPGRIPGGSSSGSAAATAAGLVDFAIGTDTGGSVRLPASFCGLYGLRPSHGRISIAGAVALAPSYDTVGWFARDAALFEKVGRVLLTDWRDLEPPTRLLVADDMFDRADRDAQRALASALQDAAALFGEVAHVTVAGGRAASWRNVFRLLQAAEAWQTHGDWITRESPAFGPGVKQRFEAAARLDPAEVAAARAEREEIRARMEALVTPGSVLALPSAPGIAPPVGSPEIELDALRARAIELTCPAGHAGLPQVSLPLATVESCPVGLSFVAPRGADEQLLALALRLG